MRRLLLLELIPFFLLIFSLSFCLGGCGWSEVGASCPIITCPDSVGNYCYKCSDGSCFREFTRDAYSGLDPIDGFNQVTGATGDVCLYPESTTGNAFCQQAVGKDMCGLGHDGYYTSRYLGVARWSGSSWTFSSQYGYYQNIRCSIDCPGSGDCTGKECGDDGAGGSCGTCGTNQVCNSSGICVTDDSECTNAGLDVLFKLYTELNSHVELENENNYHVVVCGNSEVCDGTNEFLWLSDATNSHVSTSESSTYSIPICSSSCYIQMDSCSGSDLVIASLYSLTNSHVSKGDDPNYPYKICCGTSGPYSPNVFWANMLGNYITEANLGDSVRMVSPNSPPYNITENGELIETVDNVVWLAEASDEGEKYNFSSGNLGVNDSSLLRVSDEEYDYPLYLDILSPSCGSYNHSGQTITVQVNASDLNDLITGNLTIGDDIYYFNNSNGPIINFSHSFSDAGNIQILAFANNSKGEMRKVVSNVMIVNQSSSADEIQYYVASCIDSPKNFDTFKDSRVKFNASSTRGLRYNRSTDSFEIIPPERLYFEWSFLHIPTNTWS